MMKMTIWKSAKNETRHVASARTDLEAWASASIASSLYVFFLDLLFILHFDYDYS
jgi:hypothetical protein